jgi:hypothetical protein
MWGKNWKAYKPVYWNFPVNESRGIVADQHKLNAILEMDLNQ